MLMIEAVVEANDPSAWNHLICFGTRCLCPPRRGGCRWNLASEVNKLIREADPDSTPTQTCLSQGLYTRTWDPLGCPPPPDESDHITSVTDEEVARAILSFPKGSAGGPDSLKAQHLKDVTGSSSHGEGGSSVVGPHFPH